MLYSYLEWLRCIDMALEGKSGGACFSRSRDVRYALSVLRLEKESKRSPAP